MALRVARVIAGLTACLVAMVWAVCPCRAGSPTPTELDTTRPASEREPGAGDTSERPAAAGAEVGITTSTTVGGGDEAIDPLADGAPPPQPDSAWTRFKRQMKGKGGAAASTFDRVNLATMGGQLTDMRTRGRWLAAGESSGLAARLRRSRDPILVHDTPMKYMEGGMWAVWKLRPGDLFDLSLGVLGGVNRVKWWDTTASDSESTWGLVVAPEARLEYGLTDHLRVGLALGYRLTAAFGELPDECRDGVDGISGTVLLDVIDF